MGVKLWSLLYTIISVMTGVVGGASKKSNELLLLLEAIAIAFYNAVRYLLVPDGPKILQKLITALLPWANINNSLFYPLSTFWWCKADICAKALPRRGIADSRSGISLSLLLISLNSFVTGPRASEFKA